MCIVRVYRNLNRKCFSVQEKVKGVWKVVEHVDSITLKNPTFKVYESGRQRVIQDKRKNVHAYIIGERYEDYTVFNYKKLIKYNPYKLGFFYDEDEAPVVSAEFAKLAIPNLIYIS